MRLFMIISYDGSKFNGFQRQKSGRTIQNEIEESLSKYYNESICIKGAGRTDASVHAFGQTASFDVPYYKSDLKKYLNNSLLDIKIKKIKVVSDDFHARFSAKGKIYTYKLKLNTRVKSPYFLGVTNVNLKKMKEVSIVFLGAHNFKNFVSGSRQSYDTYIDSIKFYRFFNNVYIRFKGCGFYRYMVRNLVGAMLDVGRGRVSIDEVSVMLNNPDKKRQLSTAIPNGLYLNKVLY